MAPAPFTQRDAHGYALLSDKPRRRRALSAVNNRTPMEKDEKGMHSQPGSAKDAQDMEQILSDLGNTDIASADILQAIKTLEASGDGLATVDPESMYQLSGYDMADAENSDGEPAEDKFKLFQSRLVRRTMFLLRRARIIQARAIGKRVSEEVAQTFEKVARGARKDGGGRPMGMKALVKKIETTAALQASAVTRATTGPGYYRAGTSKGETSKTASLGVPSGSLNDLEEKAGALRHHLSMVKHALDSDATASSSGAESDDEAVPYNNPHQQPLPIEKRALWTWQKSRAKIAANYTWVQAQLQELDYKIRQHNELLQTVREAKGPVEFDGEPVAYEGRLPGDGGLQPEGEGAQPDTVASQPDAEERQPDAEASQPVAEACQADVEARQANTDSHAPSAETSREESDEARLPGQSNEQNCLPVNQIFLPVDQSSTPSDDSCLVGEQSAPPNEAGRSTADDGGSPPDDGGSPPDESTTCARIRPLRRHTFKKRKLLQMHNLHIATKKAARPSDISCSCLYPVESCAVCTGRADPTDPLPPFSAVSPAQRIALADPGFHPVLSDIRDVSPAVHLQALASRSWLRARPARTPRGSHHSAAPRTPVPPPAAPRPATRQPRRLKRGRPPLSRKIKERDRDEDMSVSSHERARGRASTESRATRRPSYDIDNIVIPQSIAATTRPQILNYKEIITPKWRVLEIPETPLNNGVVKSNRNSFESEEEDISEPVVRARHLRAEGRERSRYMRKRRTRRPPSDASHDHEHDHDHDHDHDHEPENEFDTRSDAHASDGSGQPLHVPLSYVQPYSEPADECSRSPSTERETVRPYSPRLFPLPEDVYQDMLASMPDGYRPSSPEPSPLMMEEEDEQSSTLSPMSPTVYDGDDPDDAEWEPGVGKSERRKSGLR